MLLRRFIFQTLETRALGTRRQFQTLEPSVALRPLWLKKHPSFGTDCVGAHVTFPRLGKTLWLPSCNEFEAGDAFNVVGLREHIDGLAADEFVESVFAEHLSVAT